MERRIPRDAFERELMREYLLLELMRFQNPRTAVTLGEGPNEQGEWVLHFSDRHRPFTLREPLDEIPYAQGRCWFVFRSHPDRARIVWQVEVQPGVFVQNGELPELPLIDWSCARDGIMVSAPTGD